jgi:hypothetical protein
MTRALMGLIKDRHGTYCAQQKVPTRLQAAVAQVLGKGKPRQAYLKKSLAGTPSSSLIRRNSWSTIWRG